MFTTYVLSSADNVLDPEKVFVTYALINAWSLPLQLLPKAVGDTAQAVTAVARIRDFLLLKEADDQVVTLDQSAGC